MKKPIGFDLLVGECGGGLVEVALLMPLFMLLILGAIDFGRAYYLSTEIAGAAQAAAIYGSENPTDTNGMTKAAQDDAPDVPNLTVNSPVVGCECPDGGHYSVGTSSCPTTTTCGDSAVYRIDITVTGTYTPIFPWHWIGGVSIPSSISFSSSSSMRSAGSN